MNTGLISFQACQPPSFKPTKQISDHQQSRGYEDDPWKGPRPPLLVAADSQLVLFQLGSSIIGDTFTYSVGHLSMLININAQNPQPRFIEKVVGILKKGGVVIYPTDTNYGIGCDIMNKKAIGKIYQIKQRDKSKPFSFICSGLKNISHYAKVSNYAYKTMRRLLPGPYTFVLEGSKLVPKIMLTQRKTAGIRVPKNSICLALVNELGNPIITTSATMADGTIFYDASLIHDYFGNRIDAVIDGSIVPGKPSSVISLIGDIPEVIREGLGDVRIFE